MRRRWRAGEHILMRYGPPGEFRGARPLTVVEDGDDLLAAYLARGTPIVKSVLASGADIRSVPLEERFRARRIAVQSVWEGPGILKLVPRGAAHSIWLFWRDDGSFHGWYVNLEERHRRWDRGLDTRDNVLDIWVAADRRWRWKDEDELEAAERHGRVTREQAGAIRAEGARVVERIESWAPPFSDGWERWRPHPGWAVPALPDDWSLM